MNQFCRAPGCSAKASSQYGQYCNSHRAQVRRHGAVGQRAVTKADLRLYRALISARLEKNKDKPLLTQLEARWRALITYAESVREEARRNPMVCYRREAAIETLKIGKNVQAKDVIETVIAMYVMQDQEPRRFKNDQAFRAQLVRRVRGLTILNADTWIDPKSGKEKRVYRDLAPRAVTILSQWLAEALGTAGIHFAKLERQDHERKQQELKDFHQALGDMQ